jgi:hypothetical protein
VRRPGSRRRRLRGRRRRGRQDRRRALEGRRHRRQGAPADRGRGQAADQGQDADLLLLAGPERRASGTGKSKGATCHRDGHGAADLPRAEDGRAVVHGQYRGLPRGDRGGQQFRPLLHRPGHGGGQGAAGQGAGRGRRRRRSRRHRHLDLARRHHLRLRRAPRSGRADRIDGRGVRLPRFRGEAQDGAATGGYAAPSEPRVPRKAAREVPRARAGHGHRHHHGADPGPPAPKLWTKDMVEDEAGLGHRRPRRRARRQLRPDRARTRRSSPTTA